MFLEIQVEHSQKVNKFFHRNLRVLSLFDDVIKRRFAGGCNAYLVNSNSNCECCVVFRNLLFVSNSSYVTLQTFYMDFKNSQARQGRAFRHLWQMKKFGKICLLFGIVQPISLRTLDILL